jgi:uncharacterized RDD family membrane protein YckC
MAAAPTPEHRLTAAPVAYAGIATRGMALVIDAALSQGLFVIGAAMLGLIGSLVEGLRSGWVAPTLLSGGWALTVTGYFVGFWSITGQPPGMRLMHVRVVARDGRPPSVARSLVRLVGLILSIIPLFAGFLPVLVDDRRRGLADMLAGTVVLYADHALPVGSLAHDPAPEDVELAIDDTSSRPGLTARFHPDG